MGFLTSRRALTWVALDGAAIGLLLAIAGFVLVGNPLVGVLALAATVVLFTTFLFLSRTSEEPLPNPSPPEETDSGLPVHAATGLYRWWVFRDRVTEEIARAQRQGRGLAILLLEPGDLIVQPTDKARLEAANILRKTVRSGDFFAQYDEDRFVLMLPETDADGARAAASRLLGNLRSAGDQPMRWRAALVTYPRHGETADELIERALKVLRPGRLESAMRAS